jgi:hypothetical protein
VYVGWHLSVACCLCVAVFIYGFVEKLCALLVYTPLIYSP